MSDATVTPATSSGVSNWVDSLISQLGQAGSNVANFSIEGVPISSTLISDLTTYLLTNQNLLMNIGQDVFKNVLGLLSEKKTDDAFALLLENMSVDNLINEVNSETQELKTSNDNYDALKSSLEQFVISTAFGIGSKLLIALIV